MDLKQLMIIKPLVIKKEGVEANGEVFETRLDNCPNLTKMTQEDLEKLGIEMNFYLKDKTDSGQDSGKNSGVIFFTLTRKNKVGDYIGEPNSRMERVSDAEFNNIAIDLVQSQGIEIPEKNIEYWSEEMGLAIEHRKTRTAYLERDVEERAKLDPEVAKKETKRLLEKAKHKLRVQEENKKVHEGAAFEVLTKEIFKVNGVTSMEELIELPHVKDYLSKNNKNFKDFFVDLLNQYEPEESYINQEDDKETSTEVEINSNETTK